MTNFMIPFKYKTLQILEESFLVYFDRLSRWPNFHNLMIFIRKTKNGVCQCVSPKPKKSWLLLFFPDTLCWNMYNPIAPDKCQDDRSPLLRDNWRVPNNQAIRYFISIVSFDWFLLYAGYGHDCGGGFFWVVWAVVLNTIVVLPWYFTKYASQTTISFLK